MSKEKDLMRGYGISKEFASRFKNSLFYTEIYSKHKDEIIIGVRKDYVNLYYNCDSIAKITSTSKSIKAEIASYYLNEEGKRKQISPEELVKKFDVIKSKSKERSTPEKKAQQKLFIDNNRNKKSSWFCLDVEYKKAFESIEDRDIGGRFDIIAISKEKPYRIALVELKYGSGAIGGKSGVRTHIKDFASFNGLDSKGCSYFEQLIPEIISILNKLVLLGVNIPESLRDVQECDICKTPLFYIITLNDNPEQNGRTPKMSMSGYLFNDKRWGCRRKSSLLNKEGDYYKMIEGCENINLTFLFSKAELPDLGITDILDEAFYDVEIVK